MLHYRVKFYDGTSQEVSASYRNPNDEGTLLHFYLDGQKEPIISFPAEKVQNVETLGGELDEEGDDD